MLVTHCIPSPDQHFETKSNVIGESLEAQIIMYVCVNSVWWKDPSIWLRIKARTLQSAIWLVTGFQPIKFRTMRRSNIFGFLGLIELRMSWWIQHTSDNGTSSAYPNMIITLSGMSNWSTITYWGCLPKHFNFQL